MPNLFFAVFVVVVVDTSYECWCGRSRKISVVACTSQDRGLCKDGSCDEGNINPRLLPILEASINDTIAAPLTQAVASTKQNNSHCSDEPYIAPPMFPVIGTTDDNTITEPLTQTAACTNQDSDNCNAGGGDEGNIGPPLLPIIGAPDDDTIAAHLTKARECSWAMWKSYTTDSEFADFPEAKELKAKIGHDPMMHVQALLELQVAAEDEANLCHLLRQRVPICRLRDLFYLAVAGSNRLLTGSMTEPPEMNALHPLSRVRHQVIDDTDAYTPTEREKVNPVLWECFHMFAKLCLSLSIYVNST